MLTECFPAVRGERVSVASVSVFALALMFPVCFAVYEEGSAELQAGVKSLNV
jgi:hypothetical protein